MWSQNIFCKISISLNFVTCVMAQNIVYLGKYYICTRKECIFFCCWMKHSIIIELGQGGGHWSSIPLICFVTLVLQMTERVLKSHALNVVLFISLFHQCPINACFMNSEVIRCTHTEDYYIFLKKTGPFLLWNI